MYNNNYFVEINKAENKEKADNCFKLYAAMGNTANNHIVKGLDYELNDVKIIEGGFNRYKEELLFDDVDADAIYINESSIQLYLTDNFEKSLESYIENIKKIILKYKNKVIIINTLEYLPFRIFGNLSRTDGDGLLHTIDVVNRELESLVSENVKLNDVNYIANFLGLKNYFDERMIYNFSYSGSIEAQYYTLINVRNIINSAMGKTKKAVITDLDNTMWPGIIGDDGVEQVENNLIERRNSNYKIYHNYLKQLEEIGVFMGICSKNSEHIEKELDKLSIPNKIFSLNYINWESKSVNIKKMSGAWNIGTQAIVFVDDNEREIIEVTQALDDKIATVTFNNTLQQLMMIEWKGWFEKSSITDVDKNRNISFSKINTLKNSEENKDEFLKSLKVKVDIENMNENNKDRIVQLLNKTNQFNNDKQIYTIEKLMQLKEQGYTINGAVYEDVLGKEGIISVIIFKKENDLISILNWVISCRVFKRGVEQKILDNISNKLPIKMFYRETEKNNYFIETIDEIKETYKIHLVKK